jgi:hypothetical protein
MHHLVMLFYFVLGSSNNMSHLRTTTECFYRNLKADRMFRFNSIFFLFSFFFHLAIIAYIHPYIYTYSGFLPT